MPRDSKHAPVHTPTCIIPLSGFYTPSQYSPVAISPRPGHKLLRTDPASQSPLKWFKLASPKSVCPASRVPSYRNHSRLLLLSSSHALGLWPNPRSLSQQTASGHLEPVNLPLNDPWLPGTPRHMHVKYTPIQKALVSSGPAGRWIHGLAKPPGYLSGPGGICQIQPNTAAATVATLGHYSAALLMGTWASNRD